MIILLDAKKAFENSPTSIRDKSLRKIRNSRPKPKHNKSSIKENSSQNLINGERLDAIPLNSERRQVSPLSPYLFNIVFRIPRKGN